MESTWGRKQIVNTICLEKIEKINGDLFDIESIEELKKYL